MEQVGVHVSLPPPPMHQHTAESPALSEVLQRQDNTDSAVMAGAAFVRGASQMVSLQFPARASGSRGDAPWQALFHAGALRMEFLLFSLGRLYPSVVEDMSAFRPSSVRQYESNWRSLRSIMIGKRVDKVTEATVLEFVSFISHKKKESSINNCNSPCRPR